MAFKMKYKNLEEVVKQLKGAVKAHGKQANVIEGHIDKMKGDGPPMQSAFAKKKSKKKDPCWKGYEMIGMKKKGGRKVPNCVPRKRK